MHRLASTEHQSRALDTHRGPTAVFIDRKGGRLRAGVDDARSGTSGIVQSRGYRYVDVPAHRGSDESWARVMSCVRKQFDGVNVKLSTTRPESGDYLRVMVGGHPSLLGLGSTVGGIAPYNGQVIRRANAFVFSQNLHSERSVCEATAHEIGHALGLDHARLCTDTMSYGQCGPKRFVDATSACGEHRDRACGDGSQTQNSLRQLLAAVGARVASRVAKRIPPKGPARPSATGRPKQDSSPVAKRTPPEKARPPRGTSPDVSVTRTGQGPRIEVSAHSEYAANSRYRVQVRARDADGIAGVSLLWSDGSRVLRLRCGRTPDSLPVQCSRRGDRYVFDIAVGSGARLFAVRVRDGRGQVTMSPARRVRFS